MRRREHIDGINNIVHTHAVAQETADELLRLMTSSSGDRVAAIDGVWDASFAQTAKQFRMVLILIYSRVLANGTH